MMRFLPAGSAALLAEFADRDDVTSVYEAFLRGKPPGTEEFIPASRTILVMFNPVQTSHRRLADALTLITAELDGAPSPAATARSVPGGVHAVIPVTYDGPDLDEVAREAGITTAEVVRRHTAPVYTVAFSGFAPGFAYLTGVDPALMLPRRPVPRTQVPAGSVAVSGQYTSVYPRSSPGGWHLLGRTTAVMWDLARDRPALLAPGNNVRFTQAGQ
jgi:KipI family sensor histidine kinase inhibitor